MEFHTKIILHPTDFSDNAAKALHRAAELLEIPKTRLVVIHVGELPDITDNPTAENIDKRNKEKENELTEKMVQYLRDHFGSDQPVPVPEKIIRLHSSPYKDIVDYINKIEPYMVVVGQKGHSTIKHLAMGNTTQYLLEKATCPVLVVPANMEE
jgi:nucleotide-binding universal stress UspA family protein